MKKAIALFLLLASAGVRSQAQQATAYNYTMPVQQYVTGQYINIPASAFSGSAPAGATFNLFVLTQFPQNEEGQNAQGLRVTPKNGSMTLYTSSSFPAGGIQLAANAAGQPQGTIDLLPTNPGTGIDTFRIFYRLWTTGAGGSIQSNQACIFIPVTTTPLNVTLTRFAGESKDASTWLEWATASEDGLRGFDVEWSNNLTDWRVVGNIAGRGAGSVYEWRHESPAQGANFYRVRSISLSGALSFSAVVRVDHSSRGIAITASPNPTRDFLRVEGPAGCIASLFDISGKEVSRQELSANSTMDVQHLASGMYQLTVRSASGSLLAQERIVKP